MELEDFEVLILEDSPSAMMDLTSKLPDFIDHNKVLKTTNYHQAMNAVRFRNVDVALVDLSMPKENGMDFIVDLNAHPATKDIPIIVISGVEQNSLLLKALDGLVVACLRKPVDRDQLRATLEQIFQKIQV